MRRSVAVLSPGAIPLAVAAAAFTVALGPPGGDPDLWWHLASGRWMVEHRDGLRVDVFSSTATGEPYALGEWLGEVVLYAAYAASSWTGIAVLRAALVAVAAFAVTRLALRHAPARIAVPLAVAALLLSKATWTDRPQLFTLALFPVLLELCFAARAGSRAALVAAVPLVAVWSHLHGGYALGVAVLWIFALEAVLERRDWLGAAGAAVVTTFVVGLQPGALPLVRAIGHVAGSTVRIVEESPVEPLTAFGALFALFLGATLLLFMRYGASLLAAMVLVPLLWLALSAQRHVPLFGFAAVPFLAAPLCLLVDEVGTTLRRVWSERRTRVAGEAASGQDARSRPPGFRHQIGDDRHQFGDRNRVPLAEAPPSALGEPHRPSSKSYPLPLALALALAMWLGALASIATVPAGPDLNAYPAGAVSALTSTSGILFNEYDWGGYLIWAAPDRPVFVDGRLYPFAGNGVIRDYQLAVHVLPGWRAVIDRWNVSQALLRPDRALVQALRDDGWTVRSEDRGSVLLERPR